MTSSPPSSHLAVAVRPESPASPAGNWTQGLRSLWHLSRHLTARADDNHAAPRQMPRRARPSLISPSAVRARVRFLAYHRIKPHVPPLVRAPVNSFEFLLRLCGPPSIPLSFSLAAVLPRWIAYRFRSATDHSSGPTASYHRLLRGLPGYLILFDPHAFVPQRQSRLRGMPSQSVF